jgi:uncharacterized protein with LGFP repeats
MADGSWSPTAIEGGEWNGVPDLGCWFRKHGGPAWWITGGVHQHWNALGAEGGELGFPTSDFDPNTGIQHFERGDVWWDGDEWKHGSTAVGARPPRFDLQRRPAAAPLG